MVDAGDDQLRLEPDQAQSREPHAVHGRAVGREAGRAVAELHFLDPQRLPRRDAPRAGRPVRIRRDHRQLDAWNRQQRAPQRVKAAGLDAVVVREEDLHLGADGCCEESGAMSAPGRRRRGRTCVQMPVYPSARGSWG